MKKLISIFAIVAMLTIAVLCVNAVCSETEEPISPGPAPDSGDGVPSGNQYIRPDLSGMGPAPSSGDGIPDGSGF